MNNKVKSVKFNFIMNLILTSSNFLFPLITFPYVSRVLMPIGMGKIAFVTSIVFYFLMIGMLGIPTYGIRACAKIRNDKEQLSKTVIEILLINLIAMTISIILYIIAIIYIPRLNTEKTLFFINLSVLIFNLLGVEWLYKALEMYQYITIRSIVFKFLAVILMFVLVKTEDDYIMYGIISIFASVGSNIINFINLRKLIDFKSYDNLEIKKHIKPISSFFVMTVATTIYTHLDSTMLGFFKDDTEVGYYNSAIKVKTILVSLVTSLGTVLLPRLSYYVESKKVKEFETLTKKSLNFILLLSLPISLFFSVMAEQSIIFLSGDNYYPSILPMQVLMPTVLLIGISNLIGIQVLVPNGNENIVVKSVFMGAVVNFIINVTLIPHFSSLGAAIGTTIAEFTVTAFQWKSLSIFLMKIIKSIEIYKIIISAFISTFLLVILLNFIDLNVFWELVCGAIVFFGAYAILLLFLKETFVMTYYNNIFRRGKYFGE